MPRCRLSSTWCTTEGLLRASTRPTRTETRRRFMSRRESLVFVLLIFIRPNGLKPPTSSQRTKRYEAIHLPSHHPQLLTRKTDRPPPHPHNHQHTTSSPQQHSPTSQPEPPPSPRARESASPARRPSSRTAPAPPSSIADTCPVLGMERVVRHPQPPTRFLPGPHHDIQHQLCRQALAAQHGADERHVARRGAEDLL